METPVAKFWTKIFSYLLSDATINFQIEEVLDSTRAAGTF